MVQDLQRIEVAIGNHFNVYDLYFDTGSLSAA